MRSRNFILMLSLVGLPLLSFAQIDHFSVVSNTYPDFGAVNGTWGHLQFYRPFGVKGIVVDDWRDLTGVSPLSGEPFNTDRQGWMPMERGVSLWQQMHPALTAPADTAAASTLVNYRQGDGVFKDFTLWYHNSLDESTRYGWTSKLRSHPRVQAATVYDEQRHRFQTNKVMDDQYFQIEVGYDHQVNPLYMIALDSTSSWYYDDTPQVLSDRWDGSFEWNNIDSNSTGTELFAWVQGGVWNWSGGERKALSSLASLSHRFYLFGLNPADIKVGWVSKQFGGNKRAQQFAEFTLSALEGENYLVEVGVKSLGKTPLFPKINLQYQLGALQVGFQTHQLIEERIWDPKISVTGIQELSAALNWSNIRLSLRSWVGEDDGFNISGYAGAGHIKFPWRMDAMLGGAVVNKPHDWIFTEKYVNWELTQKVNLFDDALHSQLKIWGKHLYDTQLGWLNTDNFQTSGSIYPGEEILHLLNYTISGEVSTVIVSFTDQNLLHDDLWSQYGTVTWNTDFSIMANQISNSRYRYLSIIWTFDN